MKVKNKREIIFLFLLAIIFIIQLDFRDVFVHGFFSDAVNVEDIYEGDIQGDVDLSAQDYTLEFSPMKNHFAGFILYFAEQVNCNTGTIKLTVLSKSEDKIDEMEIGLNEISGQREYKVYANKTLKRGEQYLLNISINGTDKAPAMLFVDTDYLTGESSDSLLIGYAYQKSTFTNSEKALLTIFVLSITLTIISLIEQRKGKYNNIYYTGIFLILMGILAWNFRFNSLDVNNTNFVDFQWDSERLVTTTIEAKQRGEWGGVRSGLAGWNNITGPWNQYDRSFGTNESVVNGYNRTEPQITFRTSDYTKDYLVVGNYLQFSNGDVFKIIDLWQDENWMVVTLDSDRPLNYWKYGDLAEVSILDSNMQSLPKGDWFEYAGQFGLQGIIFRYLSNIFDIDILRTLCAIMTALILLIIVYLIYAKYNGLLAFVFYITFLLSPWIVNFARNLYWVEFTWFLPMATGLFCAWKIDERRYRILSYFIAYFSILIKSLCGYEYITTVMMGLITFLLVDLIIAIVQRDKKRCKLLFKTTFVSGSVALFGFITAFLLHATIVTEILAGENNMVGIQAIIQNAIRRTNGADLNLYALTTGTEAEALTASVWETICKYFHFSTEIITGVEGNLFPLLCIIPLLIFIYDKKHNKLNSEILIMYCVCFVSSITWFVLAKSHSYVHGHMNYVLWYFGYIQVCFYIVINKVIGYIKGKQSIEQRK